MTSAFLIAATVSCLIWAGLILFRGGFWRADQKLADEPLPDPDISWPGIVVVIPARNEAETIAAVAAAHGQTDYPGAYSVVIVDDQSDDGTASLARDAESARSIEIVTAPDLQPGWSGKLWALKAGLQAGIEINPAAKYYLLTDADILHPPQTARSLVAKAETESLALVSLMALLDCRGFWGNLLVPPFVFFFQKLYPFPLINNPGSVEAGAAGGCVLVRRDALEAIGGIDAIRDALIDDCALAAAIKDRPPKRSIWLGLTRSVRSLRDNRSLASIWMMVARTAFTQLRHSGTLLVLSVFGMVITYLAGPVALGLGLATFNPMLAVCGALAWGLSGFAYWPTLRHFGSHPAWVVTLPLAALLYSAMTISSAIRHWRGRGGQWKGRHYSRLAKSDAKRPQIT